MARRPTPSNDLAFSPTSPSHRRTESQLKVRRELFSDNVDEQTPPQRKRRRVLRLDDFSDDDSTEPSSVRHAATGTTGSAPKHVPPSSNGVTQQDEVLSNDTNPVPTQVAPSDETDQSPPFPAHQGFMEFHYDKRHQSSPAANVPLERRHKAREKLGALDNAPAVGQEVGGWCERHPWSVKVRDAKKRPPGHPDYDKTTLYVPPSAFSGNASGSKGGALSPFQKQFWKIKMVNYDVVIFFKKGKFYELYDIDADIGHRHLFLNFTKGGRVDMRCCGVPEQAFEKHCARLIDLGYKVGRVEQTETANAAEKRKSGSKGNTPAVCERALVRILTKGTVTEEGLLRDHRARYILAVVERENQCHPMDVEPPGKGGIPDSTGESARSFGVCYVDVASGSINIGEFEDDSRIANLERLVMFLRPYELIVNMSNVSGKLLELIKWSSRRDEAEVIDTSRGKSFPVMTDKRLREHLPDNLSDKSAEQYERVRCHLKQFPLSAAAFGAMASHLRSLLIDKETLSLGNYNLFPSHSPQDETEGSPQNAFSAPLQKANCLGMDAPTLQNLEILASSGGRSDRGSLLCFVDQAVTPAGRRLIRKWVGEPLTDSVKINDRLQAVEDILNLERETGGAVFKEMARGLKTKKDIERALPKLHRQATVEDTAVMFDDSNKRRVKDFVSVLRGLQDSLNALQSFQSALQSCPTSSERLAWLCTSGCAVPTDAADRIEYFLGQAFDVETAESSGLILPKAGAVPHYDACKARLDEVESDLENELMKWKKQTGDFAMKFYHRGKEPYQMEIRTQVLRSNFPRELELVSESKTVKRFYTPRVRRLVQDQVSASEEYESASQSVARDMIRQFDQEFKMWSAISSTCAELDALIGLAFVSKGSGDGVMCRPEVLSDDYPESVFQATALRHPILAATSEHFVSNDVTLGGKSDAKVMILTGPNAGGKSTLARQVGLAVVLAQIGCFVPAESIRMRPFHNIFVRMGASDDLARGRSTFMVEMEEVGHILNNSNSRSLVIADEVGRGTSTHDGYAVAAACLKHITSVNRCLTVFSTHYSHLGEEIATSCDGQGTPSASLYEMKAIINERTKDITFLYRLQPGTSGDSRGIYCARVAGIPEDVAADAEKASTMFDRRLQRRLASSKFLAISKLVTSGGIGAADSLAHV
eukprot:GFKZ01011920.1.p1 GENE.GFKZ01011920.1~~GFKZ01011920.1.p1  ORF type:complete len:1302 (+),score=180.29 GFKZ01011920.1:420-3908(+)